MKVVTTVHKAGFKQYGHRWIEGTKNWSNPTDFWLYSEGFDLPREATDDYGIVGKRVESLPRLEAFKKKYAHYEPPLWEFDIVRFSNKVYAAADAFSDYDGIGVWLDADCVTHQPIPEGYIESLLPEGFFMAQFNRTGYHTETGFWIMDCRHKETKAFFEAWIAWFESGKFKLLNQWHDCTTLDATTRQFLQEQRIRVVNLSGEHAREMHPLVLSPLGAFIDHRKGKRKSLDFSPENPHPKGAL